MTPKELRKAFWVKKAEVDAAEARVKVLRDNYDAAVQKATADLAPMIQKIRALEVPLFEQKNDLAALVRALRGNTALQPGDK